VVSRWVGDLDVEKARKVLSGHEPDELVDVPVGAPVAAEV